MATATKKTNTDLAVADTNTGITAQGHYTMENQNSMLALAVNLQKFCKDQKLTTTFGGKDFAQVEAWQYIATTLGIMPVVVSCVQLAPLIQVNTRKGAQWEVKYRADVDLIRIATGEKVGSGFAVCSTAEANKTNYEEYAIIGMAQTRAISRALRNTFGWLMKAAGFEATPYEEMEAVEKGNKEAATSATVINEPVYTGTAMPHPQQNQQPNWNQQQPTTQQPAYTEPINQIPANQTPQPAAQPAMQVIQPEQAPFVPDAPATPPPIEVMGSQPAPQQPTPQQQYTPPTQVSSPGAQPEDMPLATPQQKASIIQLLNNPVIKTEEKDQMLLNINRLTEAYATNAIAKLNNTIAQREGRAVTQ